MLNRHIRVVQTLLKPPRVWLLFLYGGYKRAALGTTILSNGKGHFGRTDRDNRTGQSGPPSKLVPNIPVGINRNGPLHFTHRNFRNFGLNGKRPWSTKSQYYALNINIRLSEFQSSLLLIHFCCGLNTCSICTKIRKKPFRHVPHHIRDRRGAVSLRYRNRAEITGVMCEQKPYPV